MSFDLADTVMHFELCHYQQQEQPVPFLLSMGDIFALSQVGEKCNSADASVNRSDRRKTFLSHSLILNSDWYCSALLGHLMQSC